MPQRPRLIRGGPLVGPCCRMFADFVIGTAPSRGSSGWLEAKLLLPGVLLARADESNARAKRLNRLDDPCSDGVNGPLDSGWHSRAAIAQAIRRRRPRRHRRPAPPVTASTDDSAGGSKRRPALGVPARRLLEPRERFQPVRGGPRCIKPRQAPKLSDSMPALPSAPLK